MAVPQFALPLQLEKGLINIPFVRSCFSKDADQILAAQRLMAIASHPIIAKTASSRFFLNHDDPQKHHE
jgi:hypothetical protein